MVDLQNPRLQSSRIIIATIRQMNMLSRFVFNLDVFPGNLPEEAKQAQMSGRQQGSAEKSKKGAESKGEDLSKHKTPEKL